MKFLSWKELIGIAAICTILYLLFAPVGRANRKSLGWASFKNIEQLGVGHAIYAENHDDRTLLLAQSAGETWATWHVQMWPYMKQHSVFFSPHRVEGAGDDVPLPLADAGLNHCALNRTDGNKHKPVGVPSLAHPERLILFSWRPRYTGEETVLRYAPTGMPYLGNIEPPVRDPQNGACIGSWGTDFWVQRRVVSKSEPAASTGLVAVTVPGFQTETPYTVCFVDGHAGKVTLTQLTAGTDCQVRDDWVLAPCRVTDPTKYLWGEPTP